MIIVLLQDQVNQSVLATQESFVNIYNNAGTYYSESVA